MQKTKSMGPRVIRAFAFPVLLLAVAFGANVRPAMADSYIVTITNATFDFGHGSTAVVNGTFDVTTPSDTFSAIDLAATGAVTANNWSLTSCGFLVPKSDVCFDANKGSDFLKLDFALIAPLGTPENLGVDSDFVVFPHLLTQPPYPIVSGTYEITKPSASMPEPSSALLLATSLSGILGLLCRKRQA